MLRASHVVYMTKTLRKEIMKQTELEIKYLKNKTGINSKAYKKERNFCSKLYKKRKEKYYNKINMNSITDNKELWKTIKHFLSDKVTVQTNTLFIEKGKFF